METSEALKNYTEGKVREKIQKFIPNTLKTLVTFSVDRHEHIAQCTVTGGHGLSLQVEHISDDMYASVDKMLDKLEVQLRRHKEKMKERKPGELHQGHWKGPRKHHHSRRSWRDKNEDFDLDREEVDAEDILKYEMSRRAKTA